MGKRLRYQRPAQARVEAVSTAPAMAFSTGIAAADTSSSRGYIWFPNLTGQTQFRSFTRQEARRRSQWAAWNIPPARKATRDLARWVGAVSISAATRDEDFNTAVNEFWQESYERRAGNYDASGKFTCSGWLINNCFGTFRDGDILGVHGTDENGEPKAIAIESALIESSGEDIGGSRWIDGVLVGNHYKHLAYHVRSDTDAGAGKGMVIPAEHCHFFANYETHSAARGTPALIHAIPQIMDYREIDNDIRKILKVHGLVGFALTRELGATTDTVNPISGRARRDVITAPVNSANGSAAATSVPRMVNEVFDNGEFLNLPPGIDIKSINDGREDFPAQALVKADIYAQIAMGLGVPVELLFMLDKLTGPGVRFVLRQAQEWRNYWLDQQVAWLTVDYVRRLEWAIRTRLVPRPKDPLWYRHTINYPRAITIDEGRDANAQIKRLEAGLTNWATEFGEQGEQWKPQVRQRIAELKWAEDEIQKAGLDRLLFFGQTGRQQPTQQQTAEKVERLEALFAKLEERLAA